MSQLKGGDDLLNWRSLAHGTLADLEYEGTRIEQDRVEFNGPHRDFLRITWRDMPPRLAA